MPFKLKGIYSEDIDTYISPDPHKSGRMIGITEADKAMMNVVNVAFELSWA